MYIQSIILTWFYLITLLLFTTTAIAITPQIAAGTNFTCAVTSKGGVKCWGANDVGQLGNASLYSSYTPVDVYGLTSGITAITAGHNHACVINSNGGVQCWGQNKLDELGNSVSKTISDLAGIPYTGNKISPTDARTPLNVFGLSSGVTAIAAGTGYTCAIVQGGEVRCWGRNEYGQLGDGTTETRTNPVVVNGLTSGVIAITTGTCHTCALSLSKGGSISSGGSTSSPSGGVTCWGCNETGQLGNGTTADQLIPTPVKGLDSDIIGITAGFDHTCALNKNGGVLCWGHNKFGELGNYITGDSYVPMALTCLSRGAVQIEAGYDHTCALTNKGGVRCWGLNYHGQLGIRSNATKTIPVFYVSGLHQGAAAITVGQHHACAITTDNGVKCWGYNESGQLGIGTNTTRVRPVDVMNADGKPLQL